MKLQSFQHDDWIKIWQGQWCFLSCNYFGDAYSKDIKFGKDRVSFPEIIIFVNDGRSSCWIREKDRDLFGKYLAQQVVKNPKHVDEVCKKLKQESLDVLKYIANYTGKEASAEILNTLWRKIFAYYGPHINVKYIVDYLDPALLKKYLPKFESARIVAEPVFNRSEDFMLAFAKTLSSKTKLDPKIFLNLSREELEDYFAYGKLPHPKLLLARHKKSAMLFGGKIMNSFTGNEVVAIEKLVLGRKKAAELKGSVAYPGKTEGPVRIVIDPFKVKKFDKGDILITGMTRPDFLPLIHKAGGVVTDAGGILSHAAIVARELKKPCIIGTKSATTVFKDGDMVEVDADKGIVRKI